jgi:phosphoribosyl-AMP cyclohydrolase
MKLEYIEGDTSRFLYKPAKLNFKKMNGVVPFILQHAFTKQVLLLGVLNEEAWLKSCETGILTMFRRTLGRLWTLGEEDGVTVKISRVMIDCDIDTVLFETVPERPICGHGYLSCFYHELPNQKFAHAD